MGLFNFIAALGWTLFALHWIGQNDPSTFNLLLVTGLMIAVGSSVVTQSEVED